MTVIQQLNKILQGLLTNPIVSEYDTDGWHIVKYANGRVEATTTKTLPRASVGTAIGNVYSETIIVSVPAGLFTEINGVFPSTALGNGIWASGFTNTLTHVYIILHRGAQIPLAVTGLTYIKVEGSWK